MPEHEIRYSRLEDVEALASWLKDGRVNTWFPMSGEEEIDEAAKNWISYSKIKSSLTAVVEEKPVAIATLFLMPYRKVAHHCQFYLVVDPVFQRMGIGGSMLKNILNLAKNYFKLESVHVEIYSGCPILPLLSKNRFEVFAEQADFIKEDGLYRGRILLEHFF